MAKKSVSSPRKRSRKVVSPAQSTTSSTTGSEREDTSPTAGSGTAASRTASSLTAQNQGTQSHADRPVSRLFTASSQGTLLSESEQEAYLLLLSKGASPAAACQQLGLNLVVVADTIEHCEPFRVLLERVNALLSQNVAAALYRSAMEGSVSAQTFYLKNRPPPEWPDQNDSALSPQEELTDEELIAQFRQAAPALLARLSPEDSPSAGTAATRPVS